MVPARLSAVEHRSMYGAAVLIYLLLMLIKRSYMQKQALVN